MDKKTELKAEIFDLIAATEQRQAEINELHQKRHQLLVQLDKLLNEEVASSPENVA